MKFFVLLLFTIFLHDSYARPTQSNFIKRKKLILKKYRPKPKPQPPFLVPQSRKKAGMFSIFDDVLDALNRYEMRRCSGVEINFEKDGLYYDPRYGENWWNYYCEAINLGERTSNIVKIKLGLKILPETVEMLSHDREKVHRFILEYIHIKKHIQEKIDTFAQKHFTEKFVICVHYRGTDKYLEAPQLSYKEVANATAKILKQSDKKNYTIFVASDEQGFIDHMKRRFGSAVCYNDESLHSTDGTPVHSDLRLDRYKCGEDALIDCLLLSRGDVLIRCSSNLSRWSTYFNPTIPVLLLNSQFNWLHQIKNS